MPILTDLQTADGEPPSAVLPLARLRNRADFLQAARGRKAATQAFILQDRDRRDGDPTIRVGVTCSKKVGNAVARNRAKRRLREIARLTMPAHGKPGHDYVLIGRAGMTATHPFTAMIADLVKALR